MPAPATSSLRKKAIAPLIVAAVIVAGAIIFAGIYLSRPAAKTPQEAAASSEAKAYVRNLQLSDVSMKASENFMRQQVVEITGKIANNGARTLDSIAVYCLFYSVDGREIYRERVPVIRLGVAPLKPNEVRDFRLPFDSLPEDWNQAVPKMVIAQITFAR